MESNTLANIAAIKELQWDILKDIKGLCIMGVKYHCKLCSYEATQKGNLKEHQKSVHDGIKYPCKHCSYQATQEQALTKHQNQWS